MMPAIRHFRDRSAYWNGTEGDWTACGLPWERPPEGVVHDCAECLGMLFERFTTPQVQLEVRDGR